MYKTIVLDCQTKVDSFNCEDCIVCRECTFSKNRNGRVADPIKTETLLVSI
jgi:hypothetical protein